MEKPILLKLSGEIFSSDSTKSFNKTIIRSIVQNIKTLLDSTNVGIVIGGGNFFKGNREGKELGINTGTGHEVGMLATIMNGIILQQLLEKLNTPEELSGVLNWALKGLVRLLNNNKILKRNKISKLD